MKAGIIGLGTIGSAVVKYLLSENHPLQIRAIAVKHISKHLPLARSLNFKERGIKLTNNYREILEDEEIESVIELTGNNEVAEDVAFECVRRRKHFITANKWIIAEKGEELFTSAEKSKIYVGYRATIVGIFPILSFIQFAMASGKTVRRICAVLNGTCNFILDEMERTGKSYREIIKKAVRMGLAEPDPTADVSGYDSALKLKIILRLLFGNRAAHNFNLVQNPSFDSALFYKGIRDVSGEDIKFASDMNYKIKLLGIVEKTPKGYAACVEPVLVGSESILASLKGPENGIEILDEAGEISGWFGHGAGPSATKIAVMQDIENMLSGQLTLPRSSPVQKKVKTASYYDIKTRYFWKIYAMDRPGVLAKIGNICGELGINIASVLQKESAKDKHKFVPVIITTYAIDGHSISRALEEFEKLNIIDGKKLSCYRIIE